ncbi:MAG: NUDIX domain-containing protein [Candidatus Moraniibacteriota bacterium]
MVNISKKLGRSLSQHIMVAVDTLVFTVIRGALHVLLIKIATDSYEGKWAAPGGLVGDRESLDAAASRILSEKAGVDGIYLEQLATFGGVDRDVRGRSVSVAYVALVSNEEYRPKTTEYYAAIGWKSVDRLPALAFDHARMIKLARERLIGKIGYSNIGYALLPKEFTLSELQEVYEAILGRPLDKRNFRKKIQDVKLVMETGKKRQAGASRPAKLYSFSNRTLKMVDVL